MFSNVCFSCLFVGTVLREGLVVFVLVVSLFSSVFIGIVLRECLVMFV